jgi:hypothetical protein
LWLPAVNVPVSSVAVPLLIVAEASGRGGPKATYSMNCTVPVGVALPPMGVTVALRFCPARLTLVLV